MERAKAARFSLHPFDHSFGELRCGGHDDGVVHRLKVFKTPKGDSGGTAIARKIDATVRRCIRHEQGPSGDLEGDLASQLDDAERLTEIACAYQRSEAFAQQGEAELGVALEEGSDEALDRAASLDQRRHEESERTRRGLEGFGLGDRYPPAEGVRELVTLATTALDAVARHLLDENQARRVAEARRLLREPWT
jgi:hypothetical protein